MTTHPPGVVYKLTPGTDPLGPIGLSMAAPKVQTNAGRMSATVTLSREAEDRSGDIVVIKGIRLDGHKKNPVALLNHNRDHIIGYCQDKLGAYTVKTVGDRLTGEVFFCQSSQLGHDAFRAVEAGILRGTSIGFLPVAGKIEKRNARGTIYHATNLIEATVCPIGDNEDALIEAVHKTFGTKPPCAELAACLPLVHQKAMVQSGWDGNGHAGHGNNIVITVPVGATAAVSTPAAPPAVEKKYKAAEPREVSPQYRNPHYYTCPHCGDEMTPESIYREAGEKGHTRHGVCGGSVIMKPADGGEGTLAVGSHPRAVLANLENNDQSIKTLGGYITKRLQSLREKAMQTAQRPRQPDPNAEFAPVDDFAGDPNAAGLDPNASLDPHDDHRGVVDEAVGNVLASIYDKFTSGQIDMPKALNLFELCLTHHGDVTALDGDDPDAPLDLDDEPDPEDLDDDAEGADDEGDVDDDEADAPITDADAPPPRKKKPPREKFYREYTDAMCSWITKGYRLCGTIIDKLDAGTPISQTKLRRVCEEQIETAETLEPIIKAIDEGVLVTKAKPSEEDAWAEEVTAKLAAELAARNGVNVNGEAH